MDVTESRTDTVIRYKNGYLRIVMALLAAHLLITLGKKIRFLDALRQPFYYVSLLSSFLIAYLLITVVHFVIVWLDRRYPYTENALQRAGMQTLLGLVVPCILAYLLAWGYFAVFGIDIKDTDYNTYEFPFIFIMLLVVNIYYVAYYFYLAYQATLEKISAPEIPKITPQVIPNGTTTEKKVFIVHTPLKSIPIPVKEISYFYRKNDSNFVCTFDKTVYIVPFTLQELEEQFPEFNRINRQIIGSLGSIDEYRPAENGKLEVHLRPPFGEPVMVSAKSVSRFREWIEK